MFTGARLLFQGIELALLSSTRKPASSVLQRAIVSATVTAKSSKIKPTEIKKRTYKKKKSNGVDARQGFWRICAYSTGEEYHLEDIFQKIKNREIFEPTNLWKEIQNPDFLHALVKQENGAEPQEVFVFREGAVVTWNVSEIDVEALLSLLKKHQVGAYSEDIVREESELMNYGHSKPGTKTTLVDDDIMLEPHDDSRLDKYAVSNAIASSVKLGTWEAHLSRYVDSMEEVTNDIKLGKRIRMSQAEVMRRTGELFALRHSINLSSDLLDTPDVYWDREELEKIYQTTLSYFAVNKRTRVINEKINHCIELVELLCSNLRDSHHIRLEWMIIILIMVEVMFECLHYYDSHSFSANEEP